MQSHTHTQTTYPAPPCRYCSISMLHGSTSKDLKTHVSLIMHARFQVTASVPALLQTRSTVYGGIRILRTVFEAPVDAYPRVNERWPASLPSPFLEARIDRSLLISFVACVSTLSIHFPFPYSIPPATAKQTRLSWIPELQDFCF